MQSANCTSKRMRILKGLPGLVFVAVLYIVLIMGGLSGQKTYSPMEKRQLQTLPEVTVAGIKSGTFQEKLENSLSDQFPGRDRMVKFETDIKLLAGKREINGVYFGKDDYLLEHYSKRDFKQKQLRKNFKALNAFVEEASQNATVHVMMVPTKSWILREKLPAFAPQYDEQQFYDELKSALGKRAETVLVPVENVLREHCREDIYYRTDHHWTTEGAWYGYEAYARAVGIDEKTVTGKKKFHCISTDFYGSTYAKVNRASHADEIHIYEPEKPLTVVYNMGEKKEDTLYDSSFLKTQDQYSVFTGGNQAVLEITGGEKNGKTLLLIKDSFANCLLPFLAEDYEKVIVVDLRQLNVNGAALLDSFAPTEVLILYNSAQFAQDKEFAIKCGL